MIPPSNACEGKLEEMMDVVHFEVMGTTNITTNLTSDTEASKALVSNLDQTVSIENKSDEDLSKTRESPDVSFDNELNKENLTKRTIHQQLCKTLRLMKPFDSVGNLPKFYLILNQKEWMKMRMQLATQSIFKMLSSFAL